MKELSRSDERVKSYWTLNTHCVLIRLRFPAVIEPSWIGEAHNCRLCTVCVHTAIVAYPFSVCAQRF